MIKSQFQAGQWVRLRDGTVIEIESVHFARFTIRLKGFGDANHEPSGFVCPDGSEHPLDIMEIVDAPETLPEPFERFVNVYPDDRKCLHPFRSTAFSNVGLGGKTYRCTVTPIELVRP